MIREINVSEITAAIKEMCIQANHFLSPDMDKALKAATANEESPLGKKILNQLQENLKIAGEDMIPICQDTGMAVFFIEIGQDVHFTGGVLEDAINEGVRQGYTDGYLRKSVVKDQGKYKGQHTCSHPLLNSFRRQSQNNLCTKGLWKRKHESCIYVKAGRWYRGSKKCDSDSSFRCRAKRMSSYDCRSRSRWNL